jgi:TolA-binding protein
MNFAAFRQLILIAVMAACVAGPARAQGLQVDVEEFRRLQGELADLRDAHSAAQKRISELNRRVDSLMEAIKEANQKANLKMEDAVTREELKKVIDRLAEVDEKRESDRKVVLEQLEKLGKALQQPSMASRDNGRNRSPRDNSNGRGQKEEPAEPITGKFYPHKVAENETFGEIIQAYNAALKEKGLKPIKTADVKKANPGFDPNRIRVGQEILLPVPEK